MSTHSSKRIDPNAYNALAEALAVIYWNKGPWETYLRSMLCEVPEVYSNTDFNSNTKRVIAREVIERLMANENKYQSVTISLMLSISQMKSFPNLESQDNRESLIATANKAVAELGNWINVYKTFHDENKKSPQTIKKAVNRKTTTRYRTVFMSHAHVDNIICIRYAEALRKKGIDVWLDLDDMKVGHVLSHDIDQELTKRQAFILMMTSTSLNSYWVRLERSAF